MRNLNTTQAEALAAAEEAARRCELPMTVYSQRRDDDGTIEWWFHEGSAPRLRFALDLLVTILPPRYFQ